MFYKKIVCLAASRKWSGKCIAGKDIETKEWIRPVSASKEGELRDEQIINQLGLPPKLLDIILIPFDRKEPLFCQPENILIANGKWEYIDAFATNNLNELLDHPEVLWHNEERNDRISEAYLKQNNPESSLFFIKPETIILKRRDFTDYQHEEIKKTLRAIFKYKDIEYDLRVTDPLIEKDFLDKPEGTYSLKSKNIYLCISLGKASPHDNYCYKLIAGIICI